jgi:hypothetical protein
VIAPLLVGIYILSVKQIFNLFLGSSFPWRGLISFLLLGPLGFFMGMPFPLAMKLLESMELSQHIPRMWGINGIGSVLRSSLAVAIAISYSFTQVLILGPILYLFIFALFTLAFRSA